MTKKTRDIEHPAKSFAEMGLGEIVSTLEASVPPEPKRQPPVRYAVHVPLVAVNGNAAIGKSMRIVYGGEGDELELELDGVAVTVKIFQLGGVIDAMRSAFSPRAIVGAAYRL